MDPERFDSLIHGLGKAQSRRRALAAFLAGIAVPFLPGFVAEADRKKRKGRGNGRGASKHKARGKGRDKGRSRNKQEGSADDGPASAAARDCRPAGHPCEGNQSCCNSDHVICVASGPGAAARCTPCPDGQIACANACIPACTASDQCHVAGICDPATGQCTDPRKPDGAACDDGDACTRTDTCQDGVCVGRNPVVCAASDDCHIAGECDPRTGKCSNPEAEDGAACDDGNACTRRDICQAGECVGRDPVQCAASDQCHLAGECDRETGVCSNPVQADGTNCDADGNACTAGDSCQNGVCVPGSAVTCPVCQACSGGTCQPAGSDAQCSTRCCGGRCCGDGESCVDGSCVAVCIELAQRCTGPGQCCFGLECRAAPTGGVCRDATCKSFKESCGGDDPRPCCRGECQALGFCCSEQGGPCDDLGRFFPGGDCCGTNVCNGAGRCARCRQEGETCDGIGTFSNCCNTPFGGNTLLCDRNHTGRCIACPVAGEPCFDDQGGKSCCGNALCGSDGICH